MGQDQEFVRLDCFLVADDRVLRDADASQGACESAYAADQERMTAALLRNGELAPSRRLRR